MCTQLTKIEEKQTLAEFLRKLNKLRRRFKFQERDYTDVVSTIHDAHLTRNYILRMCYKLFRHTSRNHHMTHRVLAENPQRLQSTSTTPGFAGN